MTEKFDYYKAPSDEIFDYIKEKCIDLWKTYDNTYGYVDEKLEIITPMQIIRDNVRYMVNMFDDRNKFALLRRCSDNLSAWKFLF